MTKRSSNHVDQGKSSSGRWATIHRIARGLTEPDDSIKENDRRHQAQMLAALLIFLIVLAIITETITVAVETDPTYTGYRNTIVCVIVLVIAYRLSRTQRYTWGAFITVVTTTLLVFSGALPEVGPFYAGFFDYLAVPILIGSLFLGTCPLFLIAIIDLVILFLLPLVFPYVTYKDIVQGPAGFLIVTSALFLLYTWNRKVLEHERRAELAEREQRYRTLVHAIPDRMFRLDAEGYLVDLKPNSTIGAYTASHELLGKHYSKVLPQDAQAWVSQTIDAAHHTGEVQEFEYESSLADGSFRAYEIRLASATNRQIVAIVRNITDRKRAEAEIRLLNTDLEHRVAERTAELNAEIVERRRAQEHLVLLERAIESALNGIVISNSTLPDNPIIYINPAFERITGYRREEVLGRNARFLQADDRHQPAAYTLRAAIEQGRAAHVVLRNYRKDDSMFWNELRLSPVRDDQGSITHFIGSQNDITELKQIEESLRASEERFRQLAENVREVFWVKSTDWEQMLYISPAYEEVWGRTAESLYNDPLSFLDAVHPDDRHIISATRDPQSQGDTTAIEYRIIRPDGSMRWIWSRGFPVRNEAGEIYRVVGIAEDITARKQVEEDLRRTLEAERELNELKSRFISMASHEFRSPLSTILTSIDLLQYYAHKQSEEKKQRHFERTRAAISHMNQILEDVLVIGKSDQRKLEFNPAPLDLTQFCRDLIEEFDLNIDQQHTIDFNVYGTWREALLDRKLMRHIFSNLLSNAIKYSPHGGAVHVALQYENGSAILRVQDEGIGIPPEAQTRLFDTFHRAKNVGNIPGTGLGLAIVKRAVDAHAGSVVAESMLGKGTTFTVCLPIHHRSIEVVE